MRFSYGAAVSCIKRCWLLLGGGTDLPGRIALRLHPHVMKKLRFSGRVICVTGSNGKTTTSNLIAHVRAKTALLLSITRRARI